MCVEGWVVLREDEAARSRGNRQCQELGFHWGLEYLFKQVGNCYLNIQKKVVSDHNFKVVQQFGRMHLTQVLESIIYK